MIETAATPQQAWNGAEWTATIPLAPQRLRPLMRAVQVFGFHLATVDLRQSSDKHEEVVAELLAAARLEPDYSGLQEDAKWRSNWDWALFAGSAIPPVIFGVAFGNLLQGVPFSFNQFLMLTYHGNFFGLLNPFGLLAGLVSLFMIVTQGATWLMTSTPCETDTTVEQINDILQKRRTYTND